MSSPLNVVQMEANRRNAQQSTGPRSEAGKKISSLNALRHGLTSRVVVLPSEDLAAYGKFSDEYLASLAPETFPERQCAQTIIDTQWRLNRVRSLEESFRTHPSYIRTTMPVDWTDLRTPLRTRSTVWQRLLRSAL